MFNSLVCKRCGYTWIPRKIPTPERCKQCNSLWWDVSDLSRYTTNEDIARKLALSFPIRLVSSETCRKISNALSGVPKSKQHVENVRLANMRPEVILARRNARLGKKASEATKAKLRLLKACNTNMLGHKHTIETKRKMSDARKGIKYSEETLIRISHGGLGKHNGDKNPAWKGGISFGPYCPKFTRAFKERVRKFFNYTCAGCGVEQKSCKRDLDIHHVNFNKMACCDTTKPLFVPLCRSCHSKTRWNPHHYEKFFTELIETKYGGKCYDN